MPHQPIFPYYIIKKSPKFLAHKSVFIDPNNFKFGSETHCMVFVGHIQIFGKLIIILHNHVFDYVICKPLIFWIGKPI